MQPYNVSYPPPSNAILSERIHGLRELFEQYNHLTELAIEKALASTDERFAKANEFREQQKDVIATFARQKEVDTDLENIRTRFEQSTLSVTQRYETNVANVRQQIETLTKNMNDKIETSIMHLQKTVEASARVDSERFASVHKQMQILIDSNAEVSNRAIQSLNSWRDTTSGSIKVMMAVGGFVAALVLALLVAMIKMQF